MRILEDVIVSGFDDSSADVYWWRHLHQLITANLQHHGSEGLASNALALTTSILGQILDFLQRLTQRIQTRALFLCIYDHAGGHPDESARLIYQFPPDSLDHDMTVSFSSADILPGDYLQSRFPGPLFLEPLCVGTTHLGYLIIDLEDDGDAGKMNMTALADSLGSALWRCLAAQ